MASGASFNADKVKKNLRRFQEKFPDEVARALYIETELEAKEVRRRTPVKYGDLRGSVRVEGPFREGFIGRSIYTKIVVGGAAVPYAIFVHEDLDAQHEVGQAKFLESVLLESRPYMAARVARRIELNRALA